MQTVGVNAAEASNTVKFPRFTFGCVPRWREERKEGMTEDKKKEGRSEEQRRHLDQVKKRKEKGKRSETGVKLTAVVLRAGAKEGGVWC